MIFSDMLHCEWMLPLFRMCAAASVWKDWMWEWCNEKWGRDKDAVMQHSGGQREAEQQSERDEDNTAAKLHLCYISLLQLPWVTCDKSAMALPKDFLLIYTLSAAGDPTEMEHIKYACWCPLVFYSGMKNIFSSKDWIQIHWTQCWTIVKRKWPSGFYNVVKAGLLGLTPFCLFYFVHFHFALCSW